MAETDPVFPDPFTRLLLVEGDDDFSFFLTLSKELGLDQILWIYNYKGRDKIDQALALLVLHQRFELLEHVGIVRDADFKTDAFSSTRSRINRANQINPRNQLPIPHRSMEAAGTNLKTSIMTLPDSGVEGMLEDLVLQACADDPIMSCVDGYFTCLQSVGVALEQEVAPKARSRVYIAGKAVDVTTSSRASEAWELQYIFRLDWWSWDKPAFDSVKTFLRQIATG